MVGATGLLGAEAPRPFGAAGVQRVRTAALVLGAEAPRPPGRRPQAADAQLGLRPSCRTWLILCRKFDPNGRIEAESPRNNFLKMVGATGFEPATLWSQTRCATRLRHAPSPHRGRARGALILPRFAGPGRSAVQRGAFCGDAIERGFKPRAARTAPAKSPAASKYSCRTERRPDRPRPSPFDCAHPARGSIP